MNRVLSVLVLAASFLVAACDLPDEVDPNIQNPVVTCIKTGCSGQLCAKEDMASTCEWYPQYACYQLAKCELQASGQCGFTPNADFNACLANP